MTEHDAWTLLANLWSKAKPYPLRRPTPHILPGADKEPCFGLCQSVARLAGGTRVDARLVARMQARLGKFLSSRGWNGAYLFPLTPEGAADRAEVCRKLAAEAK